MNYVQKMSFHLKNINLIGKCYEVLLLYSPSTTHHNFCLSKFLFLWNPGSVTDYVSKMIFHLEKNYLTGKCYKDLLFHSPSTTQHNFLVFKIPIIAKSRVVDGLCISKMSFHLQNINLIGKCHEGLVLYSPSTTHHNFCLQNSYFCEIPSQWRTMFRKWFFIWKILIWLENVIRIYCFTRLVQLSRSFQFMKLFFYKIPFFDSEFLKNIFKIRCLELQQSNEIRICYSIKILLICKYV